MLGDVVATPDSLLLEQVKVLAGVLSALQPASKIFIPPIPRYIFGGCCEDTTHAPNTRTASHPVNSIFNHTRQRKTIIKALTDTGTKHHRVLDFIGTFCNNHDSALEKSAKLQGIYLGDNVHLNGDGYHKLANTVSHTAILLQNSKEHTHHCTTSRRWRAAW